MSWTEKGVEYFTVSEIWRKKMLSGKYGPYKSKAEVSRTVRKMPHKKRRTKYGTAYMVAQEDIVKHNESYKRITRIQII